jgi:hypothetical protein
MQPDRTRFGFGDDETIFLTSFEPTVTLPAEPVGCPDRL